MQKKTQKELDFNRLLMVYDAFKAHTTDEMKAVLSIKMQCNGLRRGRTAFCNGNLKV